MITKNVDLSNLTPINREKAAKIATEASRYQCTLTMEHSNSILNMKSMLGLLSQTLPADGKVVIMADGCDEENAIKGLLALLPTLG